jgi:hypothetical protein
MYFLLHEVSTDDQPVVAALMNGKSDVFRLRDGNVQKTCEYTNPSLTANLPASKVPLKILIYRENRNLLFRIFYGKIILPSVLYVCETWSLTLREEHRLRVFENRVLRRIFGRKRDE